MIPADVLGPWQFQGRCQRRVDPLWHIVLHEKSPVLALQVPGGSRSRLLTLAERLRGSPIWRYSGIRPEPGVDMMNWVLSTTHVLEWLKSDRAFRAPMYWPDEVELALGANVPSPWEVANAIPMCFSRKENPPWYGHDIATLVSYACGLSVYEISKIVDINESAVLHHMVSGAQSLRRVPQFELWAMNLDWSKLISITMRDVPRERRVRFFNTLRNNPLGLSLRDVNKAMDSIVFKFSVESKLTPKRLHGRPVHKHVMVMEPR